MRALTVDPTSSESLRLDELPDPEPGPGELLVDGVAVGVCGTDREIADGAYGWPPPGKGRLILGHESLGRVVSAPDGSDVAPGDLRHYRLAADALAAADPTWLDRLITRRLPLTKYADAFTHDPDDVKVVISLDEP
ncbi:alcohol dehydrogenase catalytic domain-containing protein [Nocardia cyriacigeorgica]|uniref:Uncharacterized protein n=1 Tax=Nocardia cyriacigeorgica TaxID=135487 RepID=A0A5R8NNQ9_9NOCA|nr:alcohol dehydrogenase catalytic domain-containing protein [Nocardia cyriacigeorgica]TLF77320.1 hypothetical protein FEK34_13240 [Nocardia cyriacigeorgica]